MRNLDVGSFNVFKGVKCSESQHGRANHISQGYKLKRLSCECDILLFSWLRLLEPDNAALIYRIYLPMLLTTNWQFPWLLKTSNTLSCSSSHGTSSCDRQCLIRNILVAMRNQYLFHSMLAIKLSDSDAVIIKPLVLSFYVFFAAT